jgi:hypothetical protein
VGVGARLASPAGDSDVSDLWEDEGFGSGGAMPDGDGDDDWDEGEESMETALEDAFDDPVALEDASTDDE